MTDDTTLGFGFIVFVVVLGILFAKDETTPPESTQDVWDRAEAQPASREEKP